MHVQNMSLSIYTQTR